MEDFEKPQTKGLKIRSTNTLQKALQSALSKLHRIFAVIVVASPDSPWGLQTEGLVTVDILGLYI